MKKIPLWILIYVSIMTVLPVLFTIMALVKPEAMFAQFAGNTAALAIMGPLGLYLSRNIATAVVSGYAVIKQSAQMLFLVLLLRLVTDAIDFFVLYGLAGLLTPFILIWIVIFWGPTIIGMMSLAKLKE